MANAWWQNSPTQDSGGGGGWWDQPSFFGNLATDQPDNQSGGGFFGGISHAVGNVVHAGETVGKDVGTFFGGMVKDIAHDAVQTGKTIKNVGEATYHAVTDPGKIQAAHDQFSQATKDYNEGKITLDQLNQKYKQFQTQSNKISEGISNEGILKDKATPLQQGSAAANTYINLDTFGIYGGVKALAEQGGKQIIKAGAEQGFKGATKAAGKVLFSNGADEASRAALADQIAQGGSTAAKAATKHVAENFGSNAAFGASQGALGTFDGTNPNGQPGDVWRNAITGGLLGGALGGGQSLLNGDVRAGLREVPGAVKDAASNIELPNMRTLALNEGGYVKNPLYKGPEDATPQPGNAVPPPDSSITPTRDLTPEEQSQMQLAHEVAAHYSSPQDYVNQTAKNAWNYDKGQSGGDKVMIPGTKGEGDSYTRTSTHTPFYRQYFSENGKAPTQAAFRDQIQHALETGTDGGGIIDPRESDIYSILKDKEGSANAVVNDPAGSYEVSRQQHMDALNGDGPAVAADVAPNASVTAPAPGTSPDITPRNQRAYVKSIQDDPNATPEMKQAMGEVNPQTYDPAGHEHQTLVDNAKASVAADPEKAASDILGKKTLSDQDVVTSYHLQGQLSQQGRTAEAVNLALHTDEKLRDAGRTVKAADVVGNLSPEGILTYAARKIRKASEDISAGRGFEKGESGAGKIAQGFQDAVEGATPNIDKKAVNRAVKDAANGKNPPILKTPAKPGEGQLDISGGEVGPNGENLSTGEKVAKKVENAVTPQAKKKADALVNEITKKVKQEMLAPKTEAKKSAIDVMREVFARNKEAQEAFPEAQRILMDKAQGNPKIQEALQKFFDSELGQPVASSTMTNAIKEQMIKNQTKIADVIHTSWNAQKQSVEDVATALTKEGFDPESAQTIAKEVTDRLNGQVSLAKQKALAKLGQDIPKKARVTLLDKISKMSNLGALDKSDYLELARAKLKLPNLTESTASDLSALAQKMQGLPEGASRDDVAREIYTKINEAIPKTKAQLAAEIVSAPKSIMASYDLSGSLRQGAVLGSQFRREAKDAFLKQVKYFKSEDAYNAGMSAIRHDPLHDMALRANIALTGTEGAEEAFVSQLPEKIPILGKGIQASDRAYTGGLTELRFNSFKHIMNDLKDSGVDINAMSDEQLKSIGKFINTSSGRGYGREGGLFEKMAPALNRTLFSPRLWKSRLDMLNPAYYYKLDPIARKYALKSAGSFAAIAGTVLGLAAMAGAQVETDPRSSDFLKIRVGDTRYDILGGFQQNLVFAWRELSGQKKSSTTGEITDLNSGDFGKANRLSILSDLVSNKENPLIATSGNILKGTDATGKPINPTTEIAKLLIPLNAQDTYQVSKESDPLTAFFKATIPGTLGAGVNTYGNTPTPSQYQDFSSSLTGQ